MCSTSHSNQKYILRLIGRDDLCSTAGNLEFMLGETLDECLRFLHQWPWCKLKKYSICDHYEAVSMEPEIGWSQKNNNASQIGIEETVFDNLYIYKKDATPFIYDEKIEWQTLKQHSNEH
jgi:hypothetical protein